MTANPDTSAFPVSTDARALPVGTRFKLAYGTGSLIEGLTTAALTFYLLFYLTSVCGLSGTAAGSALLVGLLIDSVADPVIGLLSDNLRSRFGRRLPFLALSLVPLALSFALLFSIPAALHETPLIIYAAGCGLALRLCLSFFLLPYVAVGAEITDDYADRSSIVTYRVCYSMLGAFLAIALGLGVFLAGPSGLASRAGYAGFGWTCALVIAVAGLAATLATRSASARLHSGRTVGTVSAVMYLRDFFDVFRNRSFVILFIGTLGFFVGQGMANATALHLNHYFWRLPTASVQLILVGQTLGPLIGAPLTALLSRRVEKKPLAIAAFLVFVVCQAWPPLAGIAGLVPGAATARLAILFVNGVVGGVGLVGGAICAQSMMADAADEHELLFGVRREGLFFAGLSFASKAATGLGGFFAGVALDAIHFAAPAAGGQGARLPASVLTHLGLVAGLLPALITLVAPLMLLSYHLTRSRHRAILTQLDARREASGASL